MARRKYDETFKLKMVQLVNAGSKQAEVCREYDLKSNSLSQWVQKYNGTAKPVNKVDLTPDQIENIELKKINKQLEMERDILKQAALIFGRKCVLSMLININGL